MEEIDSVSSEDYTREEDISYRLIDTLLNVGAKRATCRVNIPSDVSPRYANAVDDPEAVLILMKDKNEDSTYCINIMRECSHGNILHAVAVTKQDEYFLVWTDFYIDSVMNFLESCALGTNNANAREGQRIMLPTANLRNFIRQAFDGFQYLWLRRKYHGNFTLKNTYYQNLGGQLVAKLTSFKLKDRETLKHCWAEDCQAVGLALESVSKVAREREAKDQNFDCYIIDDLARRLKEFAWGDLPYIKQEIYAHPFFWDDVDIRSFFVSEIPIAMNNQAFRYKVSGCDELCTLPWGTNGFSGFVALMDDYRSRKEMPIYDKDSMIGYVQFLSGLYVHENELKGGSVDAAVREQNPRAYMILYNLIPRPPRLGNGQ
ncbi:unnamed protein product [Urochloa decumbens]|uniref:Uncharacterized protein n=1 Tax=Urochloa decumbens TaxID=240449 RepID=A0ABC9EK17_9POAL